MAHISPLTQGRPLATVALQQGAGIVQEAWAVVHGAHSSTALLDLQPPHITSGSRHAHTVSKHHRNACEILAANLARLLALGAAYGLPSSQSELSRRSGVAQKTISNWLDPARGGAPLLDKLEMIADVYRLEVWQLLVPDLPDDVLLVGHLKKLVANYAQMTNPAARRYIERIAEAEAEYQPRTPERTDS